MSFFYDENGNQIAENDDPIPRNSNDSEIVTVIPANGKYYLRAEECNAWAKRNNFPAGSCAPSDTIFYTSYKTAIDELDPMDVGTVIEDPAMDFSDVSPGIAEFSPIPNGTANVFIKLSATAQIAGVIGNYYHCGFHFAP